MNIIVTTDMFKVYTDVCTLQQCNVGNFCMLETVGCGIHSEISDFDSLFACHHSVLEIY